MKNSVRSLPLTVALTMCFASISYAASGTAIKTEDDLKAMESSRAAANTWPTASRCLPI